MTDLLLGLVAFLGLSVYMAAAGFTGKRWIVRHKATCPKAKKVSYASSTNTDCDEDHSPIFCGGVIGFLWPLTLPVTLGARLVRGPQPTTAEIIAHLEAELDRG
jgi:hypothetical protein